MNTTKKKITIVLASDFLEARDGLTGGTKMQVIELIIPNSIDPEKIYLPQPVKIKDKFPKISGTDKNVRIVANFNRKMKWVDFFIQAFAEVLNSLQAVKLSLSETAISKRILPTWRVRSDVQFGSSGRAGKATLCLISIRFPKRF